MQNDKLKITLNQVEKKCQIYKSSYQDLESKIEKKKQIISNFRVV